MTLYRLIPLCALLLAASCTQSPGRNPQASVLAEADYPGGHFSLQDDNGLSIFVSFNEILLDPEGQELQRGYYGQRPMQLPDRAWSADRELLQGPGGWLGTCRRDGYLEVWQRDDPNQGFTRIGEHYTPLGFWLPGQYPATEYCALLEDYILTTARDQSLACLDYTGRELWSFLMGAPARLLVNESAGIICAASDDGWLYALDAEGQLLWQHATDSHLACLLPAGRIICVEPDGVLACLDASGKLLWQKPLSGRLTELRSSDARAWLALDGRLCSISADGNLEHAVWDVSMELRDLLPGPDGWLFASAYPRPAQGATDDPGYWPGEGRLLCYSASGRLQWEYSQLTSAYAILPAHNAQAWLIDFDSRDSPIFGAGSVPNALPSGLLLIGQPSNSSGS